MITFDATDFNKTLDQAIQYSKGFLRGIDSNEQMFLYQMAEVIKQAFYKYVDSSARLDPSSLHHVYEWGMAGNPGGRLFELEAFVGTGFIRFVSRLLPSGTSAPGSDTPFVDKAEIMEAGIAVTITPRGDGPLAFEGDNGEMVFTTESVTVQSPGGPNAEGGFANAFNEFFTSFLDQALVKELTRGMDTADEFSRGWGKGMNYSRGVRAGIDYATIKTGVS